MEAESAETGALTAAQAWPTFVKQAAHVRGNPLFDVEERERKLRLADALREVLELAREGGDWRERLIGLFDQLAHPRWPYDLTTRAGNDWLEDWASSDEGSLRTALRAFSDENHHPEAHFAEFVRAARAAQAAGIAQLVPGAAATWAALLNFATAPGRIVAVRHAPFRAVEQKLGMTHNEAKPGSWYRNHLSFAEELRLALESEEIPLQDMLDVQALIFLAAEQDEFWQPPPQFPKAGADPSSSDYREWRRRARATAQATAVQPHEHAGNRSHEAPRPKAREEDGAYLAMCACLGYDAPYLIEWLEFHRLVGVELFFLYNNQDREAQRRLLAPYVENGIVVLHDWPIFPPQIPAFSHCVDQHRGEARWIALVDTDEFLFSPTGRSLSEVLGDYERFPAVGVNRATFAFCGHKTRPEGLVIENYTRRHFFRQDRHVKSIVDPARVADFPHPHMGLYLDGAPVDENEYPIVGPATTYMSTSRLRINHYYTKSEAEFAEKIQRPRPDSGTEYVKPTVEGVRRSEERFGLPDEAILRYLGPLRDALGTTDCRTSYEGVAPGPSLR